MKKIVGFYIVEPTPLAVRLWVSLALALLVIFLLVLPVAAQDVVTEPAPTEEVTLVATVAPEPTVVVEPTPEPAPVPPDTAPVFVPPQPGEVWQVLLTSLFAIFASAIASPLTAPLVSVVKRIPVPFIQGLTGDQLNLGVAGILSLIMWGAVALGFGKEADTIYQLIYAVLPILVGMGANFVGNQSVYNFGVKKNIPVLGYSRTAPKAA